MKKLRRHFFLSLHGIKKFNISSLKKTPPTHIYTMYFSNTLHNTFRRMILTLMTSIRHKIRNLERENLLTYLTSLFPSHTLLDRTSLWGILLWHHCYHTPSWSRHEVSAACQGFSPIHTKGRTEHWRSEMNRCSW